MKTGVHPQYYKDAQVVCVCGNRFTVGSTQQNIQVELCYKCHPFYTGEQKFIDTRSTIKRFEEARKKAASYQATQKVKVEEKKKKDEAPKSLREMLMGSK
jgi:large subunit ribosomal protein L31